MLRHRSIVLSGRFLSFCAVLGCLMIAPIGCGDEAPKTGASTAAPVELPKANSNMEDFAKKK